LHLLDTVVDADTTSPATYPSTKANQITRDDYSVLPSLSLSDHSSYRDNNALPIHLSFPIASFTLSRDLLRTSVTCCPSIHLGRSLDLLVGSETVLSVYERVEDASKDHSSSIGSYVSVNDVLSDGIFARYYTHCTCLYSYTST